ncbi:MAG: hypothetical protein ACQES2_05150 [Pseudomonadota bacterium]
MAQRNTSLRILSVAYANGRLTSDQYLTLRNQQLSAIEFDKTPPPIPAELNNIEIPTVNVDPLRMQSSTSKNNKRLLLSLAALLLLVSAALIALMVWQHMPESGSAAEQAPEAQQPQPIAQPSAASAVTHSAMQLINSGGKNTEALDAFYSQWPKLSDSEQSIQRQSPWADELGHTLQQSLHSLSPGSQRQKTMRVLDWLGVTLQEAPESQDQKSSADQPASEAEPDSTTSTSKADGTGDALPPKVESQADAQAESESEDTSNSTDTNRPPADDSEDTQIQSRGDNTKAEDAPEADGNAEEEEPPQPTDTGYDTTPEYEPEPEFGKDARDSILGDTPGY